MESSKRKSKLVEFTHGSREQHLLTSSKRIKLLADGSHRGFKEFGGWRVDSVYVPARDGAMGRS